jgi:UrcA family protein
MSQTCPEPSLNMDEEHPITTRGHIVSATYGNRINARRMTFATLAALSAILLVNTAQAEDKAYTAQQVVRVADLNLNDSDGVEALYRRIQGAAKVVCGWPGPVAPEWWRLSKDCTDQATSQAVTAIGNPALTSRYLAEASRKDKRPIMAQVR